MSVAAPLAFVPLARQPDVMAAIGAAIMSRGESLQAACVRAGVSRNSYWAWCKVRREPTTLKLVALAADAGYEIIMVGHGQTIDVSDFSAVMAALDGQRRRAGLTIWALDERSGVPNRSYSYWLSERRQPTVRPLSTIAEALGFSLLMRPRTDPLDPRAVALAPAAQALSEHLSNLSGLATSIMVAAR